MATETKTFTPVAYDSRESSFASITSATLPSSVNMTTGRSAETYVYWPFDISSIPNNAEINSVACQVNTDYSNKNYISSATIQLYSGDAAKGSATNLLSYSEETYSLTVGTWTRGELDACRLRVYAMRGSTQTSQTSTLYIYSADLTVTYTYEEQKFMLKLDGAYHNIARVFKMVDGIYIEQTDLSSVIEDGVRYKNGGEYIAPYNTITVTGTGNTSSCYLTINGEKVTTAGSHTVDSGSVVACYISTGYYGGSATIVVDGTTVQSSTGTYNYTVNNDCTINLSVTGSTWSQTIKITITSG